MASRGMQRQDTLHIVKQEFHRYMYSNGRADMNAKHQNTNHAPELEHERLDTTHHSQPQHLPPIPSATQPPHWVPEETRYTDRDKQYHYPTRIEQLAITLGHLANTQLLRRRQDSVGTPLYYAGLRPDRHPTHLQKPKLQLALSQLPLLTRHYRWYARGGIHIPAGYTNCICTTQRTKNWHHFNTCPLYQGLDTLKDRNPAHTIAQHSGQPTRSSSTQKLTTILWQAVLLEAVNRGLLPTALYTLLRTRADDPEATAAHMQRIAVTENATQLTYRTDRYL